MNYKRKIPWYHLWASCRRCFGLSTEFLSKQEMNRFYPNGIEDYSQIVQDNHRCRWQRGDWTDDTDMMLCISEDCFIRRRCGYQCSSSRSYPGC